MSERGFVLDASALLALVFQEPGLDRVQEIWSIAKISSVNFAETVAKLHDRQLPDERIALILPNLEIEVVPFDRLLAIRAGLLRSATRHLGLSLADRACLATAEACGSVALTADRAWASLDLSVEIELIR